SIVGKDILGKMVFDEMKSDKIDNKYILKLIEKTPSSIIIYEKSGMRQIHCDLKNLQETQYPISFFEEALKESTLAILCNINFSRPFLDIAKKSGKIIATDVHTISDIDDPYNLDFMKSANILFQSDEKLPCSPEEWAKRVINKFGTEIVVVGMGKKGAMLAVKKDNFIERFNAVYTRPVVNTIGAGDALFTSFNHFYNKSSDPYLSLEKAIIFASYKIGVTGAADGFLTEDELDKINYSKLD
ncbi:MAG TPA: carbohydrate kinase family protein, partial [Spirochaetota bacterium]|nr:carbohydrate kinase family protein [Spirochaetota bacterium]